MSDDPQEELFVAPAETLASASSGGAETAPPQRDAPPPEQAEAPAEAPAPNPISFATVQAEAILANAKTQAEEMKALAMAQAKQELEQVREGARQEGYRDGYAQGMASAMEENRRAREEQAEKMERQLRTFLENASLLQDEALDKAQDDMRNLAIAVAEKVVRVSLKSSSGIIARMIQSATEKLKRKEWVHIYIAGCDARGVAQVAPRLTVSLSAVSDHIKIIPIADEEPGACIIETPDAIIDASATTQLDNIRNLLQDIPSDDAVPPPGFGRRITDR